MIEFINRNIKQKGRTMKKTLFILTFFISSLVLISFKCTHEYTLLMVNKNTNDISHINFQSTSCPSTPGGTNVLSSNISQGEKRKITELNEYSGVYCCVYNSGNLLVGSVFLEGDQDYVLVYRLDGSFGKGDLSYLFE